MRTRTIACALRQLPPWLFAAYIAGVLVSPPEAVHGVNHDHHAAFKKSAPGMRSAPSSSQCIPPAAAWSGPEHAASAGPCVRQAAITGVPLRGRIEAWRQNLWPD